MNDTETVAPIAAARRKTHGHALQVQDHRPRKILFTHGQARAQAIRP